jgi:hypothetical protein
MRGIVVIKIAHASNLNHKSTAKVRLVCV